MFCYLVTFALIFYFPTSTLAVGCIYCSQSLNFNQPGGLNTTRPECEKKYGPSEMCTASLKIQFEYNNASVHFSDFPDETLIFSNENKMVLNTTSMWFNKDRTIQQFSSICTEIAACVEAVNMTYNTSKFN
jgi:hypothetical protein